MQDLIQHFRAWDHPTSAFISIEGIEGAGKSSVIQKIEDFFQSHKKSVLKLREPGGTSFGEKLREAILESNDPLHPMAEAYLMASSRAQLLSSVIEPTLKKENQVIICDRYIDSSLAYQGVARELGLQRILAIHQYPPLNLLPQLTFYLRIDWATSHQRQNNRNDKKDYFESETKDFYEKLISGYDQAAQTFPERIKVIDASLREDQVFAQILPYLKNWIAKNGK